MNAILAMSSFLFPLITFPYVSRVLLPTGTGRVSFAISFVSYFSMFAQLGIPTYGIRICAKLRDNRKELSKTVHELLFINVVMSGISYVMLAAALILVPRLQEDRLLYLIVSCTIMLSAIGMEWLYKALEQYGYITVRSILFKLVALAAMFLFIHRQSDYIVYAGITIFASSASNILNFINVHRFVDVKFIGSYNVRRHMKPILIFFAMTCATTIYTHLDTVMLGFIATDKDVGYYNAAVKIKGILVSIVTSLGAVLLPRASYYIEHGLTKKFDYMSKKAINFVFLIACPVMAYFIIFATEGINFLSGSTYTNSIMPMRIIMPTILFIGLTNIFGIQILVPLEREKLVLYSEIAGAIVNIIINAVLIPYYASVGAAIGTFIAEFVVFLVQYIAVKHEMGDVLRDIHYKRILVAIMVGTAVSLWVKRLNFGYFISLLISSLLFFGGYGAVLLLAKEQLVVEIVVQVKNIFLKYRAGK